jgi:predicted permease
LRDQAEPLIQAGRRLWRNRSISLLVILSLGLGIGANTAVFTIIDALFLEPLPLKEPDRVVAVTTADPRNPSLRAVSVPNFRDLHKAQQVFENLAVVSPVEVNASAGHHARLIRGQLVSGEFFATAGVAPLYGDVFSGSFDSGSFDTPGGSPPGPRPVAVSHSFWKNVLQGDPGAVGRTILLNTNPFTITAVMPPGFHGFERVWAPELWLPLSTYPLFLERADWFENRRALMMRVFGRLKPGVALEDAAAAVDRIGKQLAEAHPVENRERTFSLLALDAATMGQRFREQLLQMALLLMTAAGLVLLIAIANAGNALLARASVRRREMAVRIALGAMRRQILVQIFWDSAVLVFAGSVLGLLFGCIGRNLMWTRRPEDLWPGQPIPELNWRVLLFVAVLAIVTGVLGNLLPLLQTLRGNIVAELRERAALTRGALASYRVRELLVVSQVALSMVSLVVADLFLKSLRNAESVDPGYEVRSLAAFTVNPRSLGVPPSDQLEFLQRLRTRIESMDKVQSVAISATPPFEDDGLRRTLSFIENATGSGAAVRVSPVSERYFETTDILILRGRDFTVDDRQDAPLVAIVNESAVRRYWPGKSPIGRKLRFFGDMADRTVVGVARDTANRGLREPPEPAIYVPLRQEPVTTATLNIRTLGEAGAIRDPLVRALRAFHRELPVELVPASKAVPEELWAPRAAASLLAAFGVMALLLAAIGVYGVTAHLVTRRTGEIGVRMAMGACPVDVMELVLSQCVRLILPGLAIGILISFGLARMFGDMLFGVSQMDLEAYLVTSILLAVVALLASYLPARRVTRIAPMLALRHE